MKGKDLDEEGFDVIVDTTGNPEAINKAFPMLCKGGKYAISLLLIYMNCINDKYKSVIDQNMSTAWLNSIKYYA